MVEVKEILCWIVIGKVIFNKGEKMIIVLVECWVQYLIYGKIIKWLIKLMVYDEQNQCNEGDLVIIEECCLLFKCKIWMLVNVVEQINKV